MRWLERLEARRLLRMPRYTPTTTKLLGRTIQLVDAASYRFMVGEIFDRELFRFRSTGDTPFILDCGANIGLCTIYFKTIFPKSRIIAFEPDPDVFRALEANVRTFSLSGVQLIPKALWNSETSLAFFQEGADGGRVALSADDPARRVDVPTVRLSQFLQEPVEFLKLDIEGSESVVIAECAHLLRNVKRMMIEYHSFIGHEQPLDEILAILRRQKFRFWIQHTACSARPFVEPWSYVGIDNSLNIFAERID